MSADVYLNVQTRRAGKVKGEAITAGHEEDIIVRAWRWGMAASSAIGSTQTTARRSYRQLTIDKAIDSATTALMSALATNDEVREATLTMRKAGETQIDYFRVTLGNARIVALDHCTDEAGATTETVSISFCSVEVEYRPQQPSGASGAAFTFNDELLPA